MVLFDFRSSRRGFDSGSFQGDVMKGMLNIIGTQPWGRKQRAGRQRANCPD